MTDDVQSTRASAKKVILVVDDDIDIRVTLADALEDEGYAVSVVSNGLEALDYLRKKPTISLVLLDLMMPVMDGIQFREEQKRDPAIASIPVVVMTARGALSRGAIDVGVVLPKPLDLSTLIAAIHRVER